MTPLQLWPDLEPDSQDDPTLLTIPEVRGELLLLARQLEAGTEPAAVAAAVRDLVGHMWRRRGRERAPIDSRPMTPLLRLELRAFAIDHPQMTEQAIGQVFRVNAGRVSEALNGTRA